MSIDYEPLDLTSLYNAGSDTYDRAHYVSGGTYLQPRPEKPPIGQQKFHGMPFQIGENHDCCFLGFGENLKQDPVTIVVGKNAHSVLFAHAVLETHLWKGGPLGVEIAHYHFQYADNTEIDVPIRERFEIGNYPLPWGQYPFLCLPDQKDYLEDRYEGRWERLGFRATEVTGASPQGYFIWAWENPHPDTPIRRITIVPGNQLFVVAAITLGHVDEFPLVRSTSSPIRITLADEEAAKRPFALEVEVDRGSATHPYTLPTTPLAEMDMQGFGAPENHANSPAYTHIAANPSATLTVKLGENFLGAVNWGKLETEQAIATEKFRLEVFDPGKNWVKVTVVDDDTNLPTPCRIAFHSPEGIPYPPHGHHAPIYTNQGTWNNDIGGDIKLGQITYALIDGTCEGWLPRGKVLVDIARGFEYEPLRTWVEIEPGQQRLNLRIKRWINMNKAGYFSGDTHVHFLSAQGSQNEAAAEDLNVVNLLQSQWGHYFSNTEEFTGRPHVSPDGKTIVYVAHENRQHILGHLSLLGVKTPIMPWASGGPGEAELGGGLDITLSHWADAAHKQGATVVLPHIPTPNAEAAVLIATGRVDAVEMLDFLEFEHLEYYRYLNGGYRLPIVGGTDKMDNSVPVGLYRTYVQLLPDEEFNYNNWCKALRAGRTFLSGGALIWLTIDGQPIGSELKVGRGGTVEIETHAESIFPIHTLQIVERGRVIAETSRAKGSRSLQLKTHHKITGDSWLAARCAGPNYTARPHYDVRGRGIMAHTSPIYITCGEEYTLLDPSTAQYMLTLVSGGLSYIRNLSPQHRQGHVTHHHGLEDHIGYLEEPFREALAALHKRMHELGIPH